MINGTFGDHSTWKFVESKKLPSDDKIVSVCGTFFFEDKVILVRNKRGWEIPGGHREKGETVEETLFREIKEEVGLDQNQYRYQFYGYREVITEISMHNKALDVPYPIPYYLAHYIGIIKNPDICATGDDVLERKFFSIKEVKESGIKATELILHAYDYKNNLLSS